MSRLIINLSQSSMPTLAAYVSDLAHGVCRQKVGQRRAYLVVLCSVGQLLHSDTASGKAANNDSELQQTLHGHVHFGHYVVVLLECDFQLLFFCFAILAKLAYSFALSAMFSSGDWFLCARSPFSYSGYTCMGAPIFCIDPIPLANSLADGENTWLAGSLAWVRRRHHASFCARS